MRSLDLYRFEGKVGATTRGAVTFAVDEDDLRDELRMEKAAPQRSMMETDEDELILDELILEEDAPLWNEILGE